MQQYGAADDVFSAAVESGLPEDVQVENFRLEYSSKTGNNLEAKEKKFYQELNEFLADHVVYDIDVNESIAMTGEGIGRKRWFMKEVHVYYQGGEV